MLLPVLILFNYVNQPVLFNLEINNLRLTAPLEITMANLKQFKLVKTISWTEVNYSYSILNKNNLSLDVELS